MILMIVTFLGVNTLIQEAWITHHTIIMGILMAWIIHLTLMRDILNLTTVCRYWNPACWGLLFSRSQAKYYILVILHFESDLASG